MINKTNWEEEFDKEFPNSRGIFINNDKNNLRRNAIKSFFTSQLKQIKGEIKEGMGNDNTKDYNQALSDSISIIDSYLIEDGKNR